MTDKRKIKTKKPTICPSVNLAVEELLKVKAHLRNMKFLAMLKMICL
jgi:hypothetical protein